MKLHGVGAFAIFCIAFTGCDQNPMPPVASPNIVQVETSTPPAPPQPTETPALLRVTGKVLDLESGDPLVGASVVISHEMFATDTAPVTVDDGALGTTDDDGSFRLVGIAPGTYPVEVFAPGHIAIHEQLTILTTTTDLPPFRTSRLTPEEQHWLAQLNRDRAGWGAAPLVADEAIVEAARMRASTMADNGIFSHNCLPNETNCLRGPDAELAHGAFQAGGENIGAQNEGTWRDVESGMIAEWTHCTPAARRPHADGCNFSEETGHFLNMINRTYHFVGVAAHHHGRSFDLSFGPSTDYYTMEFE